MLPSPPEPEGAPPSPTRARFVVAGWLCGLSGLLYLDRICMGQAVVPIQTELGLTNTAMSYALMSFTLAYGLFAVPTGRLGDTVGPRAVLAVLVLAWSGFTALTGLAAGLLALVAVRFLFGAAESGALPNAAKVVSVWFPAAERGRVQGLLLAFAQLGAVAAPAATAHLIGFAGWRPVFFVYGSLGALWALGFWFWFRDDPARHPGVNSAERNHIRAGGPEVAQKPAPGPVPWRAVARNRGVLVLCLIMVLGAFYTYFFYSWFQKYLSAARGVGNIEAGNLTSVVMAGSAVGMLFGGWLADRLSNLADPVRARRYVGVACYLVAAGALFLGIRQDDSLALALLWGLSFCAMHVTLPNWWLCAIPQGGRHTATLCGLMNGFGVFGAMASQGFVGWFADSRATRGYEGRAAWDPMFDVYVGVLLLGAAAWWLYTFVPLPEPPHAPKEDEGW